MTAPKEIQVFGAVIYKYWFLMDVFIHDPLIFTLFYRIGNCALYDKNRSAKDAHSHVGIYLPTAERARRGSLPRQTLSYKVISSSPSSMIGTCNVVPGVI